MTTDEKESAQPSDELNAAVEEAAQTVAVAEPAQAPSYVTTEQAREMAKAEVAAAIRSIQSHFQRVADKQIGEAKKEVVKLRTEIKNEKRQREEAAIMALPEEERGTKLLELTYRRLAELEQRQEEVVAPRDVAVAQDVDEQSVVQQVQEGARDIAQGSLYYDMRVWKGTNPGLGVEANLDIIRRNVQALSTVTIPQGKENLPPPKPAAKGRQPETIPTRPSPASGKPAMNDDEVQDWIIREPTSPEAHKAYRDMMARWQRG